MKLVLEQESHKILI